MCFENLVIQIYKTTQKRHRPTKTVIWSITLYVSFFCHRLPKCVGNISILLQMMMFYTSLFREDMEKKILILIFFSPRLSNRDNLDSRLWSQGTSWRKSKCPLYSLSTLNVLQIDTFLLRFYIVVPFPSK